MRIRPLAVSLLLSSLAVAQEETKHPYDTAKETIDKAIAQQKKDQANNPDIKVFDGLVADRKLKRVEIYACATGIGVSDAVEFFITPLNSGKDYESLSVTWVKPSDVHKALEFIGVKPGRPVNFDTNHQWARGPRVTLTFTIGDKLVRAEDLIIDTESKASLPRAGMIFTGSRTQTDENGKVLYGADEVDSKAIAPNYNDPIAVLDMPRRIAQGAVYGFQRVNPKFDLKQGQELRLIIEPAKGEEDIASRDVVVSTIQKDGKWSYDIKDPDGTTTAASLPHVVETLSKKADGKSDLFTSAAIDPAMPVTEVRKLYAVLMTLEKDRGVKLDPPPEGNLFHRAFFPDETWRNREDRLGEPWELFLSKDAGKIVARLERQVENFEPDAEKKLSLQHFDPKTPAEFVDLINNNQSQWTKAVFVYPPEDLTYGELLEWAKPALATYPRIFIFMPGGATTQPTTKP